jgi:uncharacterized membrane protein YqhA
MARRLHEDWILRQKQKLLGSIVAIAAVIVLEWFMDIDQHTDNTNLVDILMAFQLPSLCWQSPTR